MTLDAGKPNLDYIIDSMELPQAAEKHLEALGMTHGTKISVLNNKSKGTLIVKVRGTRFAMGKGISGNIMVTEA